MSLPAGVSPQTLLVTWRSPVDRGYAACGKLTLPGGAGPDLFLDRPQRASSGQTTQKVEYQMDSEGWPRVHTLEDGNGIKSIHEYGLGCAVVKVQGRVYQLTGSGSRPGELLSQKKRYTFNPSADRPTISEIDVYKDDGTPGTATFEYTVGSPAVTKTITYYTGVLRQNSRARHTFMWRANPHYPRSAVGFGIRIPKQPFDE